MALCDRFTSLDATVETNVPLKHFATFRVGGPVDVLVKPRSVDAVLAAVRLCLDQGCPLYVFGRLSNVLVSDSGLRGVALLMDEAFGRVTVSGTRLTAEAGAPLQRLASWAARNRLGGLAFAAGIPGTVGGAVLINAGAYDGQMADVVETTRVVDGDGCLVTITGPEHRFSYRASRFIDSDGVIVATTCALVPGDETVHETMATLQAKRMMSQPLASASAGSAFKRPPGRYAGPLIQAAGMQGYKVGDASVSTHHAGFIVNDGAATAADVARVFCDVQAAVFETSGVTLQPEVLFAGAFDRLPDGARSLRPRIGGVMT